MGWKLELGIVAALLFALVMFRNQIKGVLSSSGSAIGEGIGAGLGGLVGGIPAGFAAGVTSFIPTGTSSGGQATTSPYGIPGPFDFLVQRRRVDNNLVVRDAQDDPTITPYNRERGSSGGSSPRVVSLRAPDLANALGIKGASKITAGGQSNLAAVLRSVAQLNPAVAQRSKSK